MIASLSGIITQLNQSTTVIEVSGIGYLVSIAASTSKTLKVGESVKLHTSMIIREDSHSLFGFLDPEELEAFDLLRSVSGVGPKSALGILSELTVAEIASAVQSESDQVFRAVSGIGPKTAKLIVLTLAGKIFGDSTDLKPGATSETEEVVGALVGLGWSEQIARGAVSEVSALTKDKQEVLKLALKYLASSSSRKGSL